MDTLCSFYSTDSPTVAELVSDSDDNPFENVLSNDNHVLSKHLWAGKMSISFRAE